MALTITTMNTDVFVKILSFLNAEDFKNLPLVSKYFNQVSDSESCKALWIWASKSMGIRQCLPGKTWKQTFCMINDRFENHKYSLTYVTGFNYPKGRLQKKFCEIFRTVENSPNVFFVSHMQQKLFWGNADYSKCFAINFPCKAELTSCAKHGNLLALNFHFFSKSIMGDRSVLQVWDVKKERKILEHKFSFETSGLGISESMIALSLHRNGCSGKLPKECAVFDCSRETAVLDFQTKRTHRRNAQSNMRFVCALIMSLLVLFLTLFKKD